MRANQTTRFVILLAAIGIAIGAAAYPFRLRFPFDDTFISFRYAENLALGHGFVWNIGGPHCEGYTNFLFVLILALARLLHLDLLAFSQALGLCCTITTGILLFLIVSRVRGVQSGLLASAFWFVTPLVWINALSGMETSLFVLLIVASIFSFTCGRTQLGFFVALLATLTRPEAGLLAILGFAVFLGNDRQLAIKQFLFGYALPLCIYALWKYFYFGNLLPNSFYVKVLNDASQRALPGLQYVRLWLTSTLVLILCSLFVRSWRRIIVLLLWPIGLTVFFLFVLPLEGLYDRFMLPAFASLAALAAIGLSDRLRDRKPSAFTVAAVLAITAHLLLMSVSPRTMQSLSAHEEIWDAGMGNISHELAQFPHFDSLLLAYGDAGYVVYTTGIRHLDLFGLNTTALAHARTITERREIVVAQRPDIMLLPIALTDSSVGLIETAYGAASGFRLVGWMPAFPYRLGLFINPSSPFSQALIGYTNSQTSSNTSFLKSLPSREIPDEPRK